MTKMEKEILEQPKVLASLKGVNEVTIKNLVSRYQNREISVWFILRARGTSDHASIICLLPHQHLRRRPLRLWRCLPVITAYDGKLCLKDALVIGVSPVGEGWPMCLL